ncbi:hypothetical protein H4Q26_012572 [Puccinia striiformis f. sp. tritici PST-130]|uniref:Uncharacterized protein n=1 Tax=Puccinia striiformis f. sp. tritici PST-78 TaxID=1165861 RepID=A0A0L0VUI3_9BASI|nr:hypothetical protein H4Q26_012572 [Puccinia striiformis f. sp. tritici PST-130]KNF02931.1 hypothetical protein PSTG_03880 [Puccinia striiformis f. sp. tritici PST-78]
MQDNFLGYAKTTAQTKLLRSRKLLINSPGYISHCKTLQQDLIPSPSKPVLTAPSEPALCAMEELVMEHENQPPSNSRKNWENQEVWKMNLK